MRSFYYFLVLSLISLLVSCSNDTLLVEDKIEEPELKEQLLLSIDKSFENFEIVVINNRTLREAIYKYSNGWNTLDSIFSFDYKIGDTFKAFFDSDDIDEITGVRDTLEAISYPIKNKNLLLNFESTKSNLIIELISEKYKYLSIFKAYFDDYIISNDLDDKFVKSLRLNTQTIKAETKIIIKSIKDSFTFLIPEDIVLDRSISKIVLELKDADEGIVEVPKVVIPTIVNNLNINGKFELAVGNSIYYTYKYLYDSKLNILKPIDNPFFWESYIPDISFGTTNLEDINLSYFDISAIFTPNDIGIPCLDIQKSIPIKVLFKDSIILDKFYYANSKINLKINGIGYSEQEWKDVCNKISVTLAGIAYPSYTVSGSIDGAFTFIVNPKLLYKSDKILVSADDSNYEIPMISDNIKELQQNTEYLYSFSITKKVEPEPEPEPEPIVPTVLTTYLILRGWYIRNLPISIE
ncbi:hypothetical protein EZS27_020531 [termite gut metagenome]|uniref:Uncharacterized protein n=1 Tax=termite gut metagenome TaxID=433724 RepID=A0A5J4RCD9_9ZZZZ